MVTFPLQVVPAVIRCPMMPMLSDPKFTVITLDELPELWCVM